MELKKEKIQDIKICLMLLVLAISFYSIVLTVKYQGFATHDALDYAQIARHVVNGEGFSTSVIIPISLLTVQCPFDAYPNLWRPPLYPLLVAIAFKLFGIQEISATLVSGLFYILLVPLIYLFGKKLYCRRIGIAAAIICVFDTTLVKFGIHALTEATYTFFLVLFCYLLYKKCNPILLGLIFGICYLTRYNIIVSLPLILVYIWLFNEKNKWRYLFQFGIMFIITILPWCMRNIYLTGNPFFSIQQYMIATQTDVYPGLDLLRGLQPINPLEFITNYPIEIIKKSISEIDNFYHNFPRITNFIIMAFFTVGLFVYQNRKIFMFKMMIVLMIFLQLMAFSIVIFSSRYFFPFIPIIIVLATERLFAIFAEYNTRFKKYMPIMLIGIIVIPSIGDIFHKFKYSNIAFPMREEIKFITLNTEKDAIIVTDQGTILSWYCNRITIWIPTQYKFFERIIKDNEKIRYVYLSPSLHYGKKGKTIWEGNEKYREREYIDNPKFLARFRLIKKFNTGATLWERYKFNQKSVKVN